MFWRMAIISFLSSCMVSTSNSILAAKVISAGSPLGGNIVEADHSISVRRGASVDELA